MPIPSITLSFYLRLNLGNTYEQSLRKNKIPRM